MGKYDVDFNGEREVAKLEVLGWIANELAEHNRLKRIEIHLRSKRTLQQQEQMLAEAWRDGA